MTRVLPWLLAVAALAGCAVLWWGARLAGADRERQSEAAELRARGLIVARDVTAAALAARVAELETRDGELRQALERARREARDARVVRVVRASTAPVTASAAVTVQPTAEAPCLVRLGDRLQLRVDEVDLLTERGNTIVVGSVAVDRLDPAPVRIAAGAFEAALTRVEQLPPPDRGWPTWAVVAVGAGAAVLGGLVGLGVGAVH